MPKFALDVSFFDSSGDNIPNLALFQDGRIYQLITVRNNFKVARLSTK